MEKKLNYDVLRMVFKYFSGTDLSNAAQVCRSWLGAANDENKTRGPLYIIRSRKRTKASFSFDVIKKEMIKCLTIKPTFSIFLIASEKEESLSESMPDHTYMLIRVTSLLKARFFHKVSNVQIVTLTLNKHPLKNGIYCEELKTSFDASFNNVEQLKTVFDVFEDSFNNDSHKTSYLILLYEYMNYGFIIRLNLLTCLENCPSTRTLISGGIVQK